MTFLTSTLRLRFLSQLKRGCPITSFKFFPKHWLENTLFLDANWGDHFVFHNEKLVKAYSCEGEFVMHLLKLLDIRKIKPSARNLVKAEIARYTNPLENKKEEYRNAFSCLSFEIQFMSVLARVSNARKHGKTNICEMDSGHRKRLEWELRQLIYNALEYYDQNQTFVDDLNNNFKYIELD
jgi:hypothetical protein